MPHTPPQIRNSTSKASTQRNTTPAFAATPTTPHTQQPRLFIMAQQLDYVSICGSCPAGDGWGPSVTTETTLHGVPYAPFSKGDKLGRMADWTAEGKDRERGGRTQYNRNFRDQQVYGSSHAVTFNAPPAEDESTFSVVTNTRDPVKTRYGRGAVFTRGRGQRGAATGARGGARGGSARPGAGGRGGYDSRGRGNAAGGRGGRRFGWRDYDKPARNRDASINIKADWDLLEEIDFNRLGKLNLDTDDGEDLADYGFLYSYDRSYDKQPVKGAERKLTAIDRAAYNVTTSSDPIIQDLADKDEATIFTTDTILSMLMCSPRSVYPWDIVIVRQGNKIFLDKRDNANLDMVTVNENAADAPLDAADGGKDTINQPGALAEEATYINHNFANQVVSENDASKVDMANSNPFYNASEDTDPPASKAYKYRRFDLSTNEEEPVYLVVRTEVDAVQKNPVNGEDQHMTIRALNEFDSRAQGSGGALDWRAKLVTQRGAVVATEMKNNSCKLARWTVQSILSKSDVMKVGFVSRVNPRSNDKHVILGVIGWKPRDFAAQMNLSLSNGWGIVRTIADMCLKHDTSGADEAKFVLVKDPNKSILRLYEVPAGSFDEEEEEEEEEEEDDEDDE
ncbi:Putative Eukaryotic translation initiation factor 3 subunit D [[Torrubiella] hemipterigena]|uniref:Eukaryotic translation initiation factor 3 subunit D n=1 Tax=[Torrubiella] hemipterigena TaxID=1531966 RepID=A0A0A1SPH6_9HYPO|nr:Putative Eukaryotic translation initiation factor 3 subunit D [[Torrubiella] hemipterigena]